jgi:uncharacterized protein
MAKLFALADLHLSGTGDKPMDVFGETWRDHPGRMAREWDRRVQPEDHVLLAGDLSWARNLEQAAPDLAWIAARPGRKLLLRGNHDSWWTSAGKVRQILPPAIDLLHNDAHRAETFVVVGARGWTDPRDPHAEPTDARIFRRELERLRASIADADERFDRLTPRLALVHFPPWLEGREPSDVVEVLHRGAVRVCVYGHLHGDDHRLAIRGERAGIRFEFVAADAVGFAPVEIAAVTRGVPDGP